jgi:uncharacterized repeat protein (TIGR04138 family)
MSQQKQQQPREPGEVDWKQLAAQAGPYPVDAFHFVREGLSYAATRVHDEIEALPEQDRHITGQQLCMGLRDFAIERYGLLAPAVLGHWNIRRTEDFGRIVFAMVEHGLLSKTSDDTLEDFRSVYDFQEAFSASEVAARIGAN